FSGELGRNFFPLATLLNNVELSAGPLQIAIIGETGDPARETLRPAVYDFSLHNRILLVLPPDDPPPPDHPPPRQGLVDGQPAVYLCKGQVCSLPITDPEALRDTLARA